MFCAKCGYELGENAKFCGRCGAKIVEAGVPSPAVPPVSAAGATVPPIPPIPPVVPLAPPPDAPKGGRKKKKISKFFIIAGIVAAVAVIFAAVFVAVGGIDKVQALQQLSLGNKYLDDLDYEEAIAAFEAAIEIEPKMEKAYIGLAEAYIGLGDYDSAIRVLEEGIEETDSDRLRDYLEEIEESQRRFCGGVYAVDTDLDDTNNVGIPNAYIELTDSTGETSVYRTDEEGQYDTGHLSKGNYSLYFHADGYVEYREDIRLTGGKYELNVYVEPDSYADLYGNVQIADGDTNYSNNAPLEGAEISLKKLNGSNAFSTSGSTNAGGQYAISDLLMGVYSVTISKPGYLTAKQTLVIYEGQSVSYNTVVEAISTEWSGTGTASGTVYDALTGDGVAGLTLRIRKGISNMSGEVLASFETDEEGRYQTPDLDSGNYSIEISDNRPGVEERYLGTVIDIKVLGGMNIDNQDGTVSNTIQTGQVRVVLTWGATPADLDSHLQCSLDSGNSYHIYYGDKTFMLNDARIADLDLDDTTSYGPETTTIYRGDAGEYLFWVHNYTGDSEYGLANSGACVQVYMGYSVVPSYVFYVPNEAGYGWEVFRYNSVTGVLTPSNVMYSGYYW